ncbi:uncharacterized protein HMPREF1541_05897 [Cyphellophora europaea CBS 101466]|uniref:MARVEL domain-containing protein n=1 Tax=Cyphellophora europaea (strain CBS 101466) TaxID=1220924 RepID=W2RT25_CYPE1|nr:uncharacterized protein HMPREF1541_05897 [Cyphellophora europaea CBS 101466]ETN39671.1 hypothetical protein HMPREF1541_05897 [Cyphellophora europaea CBS 101466]
MALTSLIPSSIRSELATSDPRWRSKTILHLITINLALVAIILFATSIELWDGNFFHATGPSRGDWTDGFPLAPLCAAFIFSSASVINTFVRQKRLPILLNIITYAFIIIILFVAIVFAGVGGLFPHWQPEVTRSSNGAVICNSLNMFTRECEPMIYRIGELQIAAIIFSIFVWLNTTFLTLISIQEWRDMKAGKNHQLRKLELYNPDYGHGGRTGSRLPFRGSVGRMSYLKPPSRHGFSRYSRTHNVSTDTSKTVPFVFVTDQEPSYPPPIRYR